MRVYHIGNSVTDTINYNALKQLAATRGRTYTFGRHMIPGAPLQWIYEHPDSGFKEDPYGYYPRALPGYEWDALTLQPFDRHLSGSDGDLSVAKRFIELAQRKNPQLRVYIYSRWPRREKNGALDFERKWLRKYTGSWDNSEETRDYFEQVVTGLRRAYPQMKDRIFLVPVGDALLELDRRMQAGRVPGYKNITAVYKDGIHFNAVGSYIVGCTFYATLFRDNPRGMTGIPYGVTDTKLAGIIQDAVWKVTSAHPLSGVKTV